MNVIPPLATLAALAGVCILPAGELPCGSAESMDGLMQAWTAGFTARHPDTPARITLRTRFSADLVDPLARGEVIIAPFAREWFPAEREHFIAVIGGPPTVVPVAIGSHATKGGTHAIAIFVHEKNPLARLSVGRLRDLFAGESRVMHWGQLGLGGEWADRKIVLHGMQVRRESGNPPGIVNFLNDRLLAGQTWRKDMVQHSDEAGEAQALELIVRAVAADEAAIGYSGLAYTLPGVKVLALTESEEGPDFECSEEEVARKRYPLTRMLYLGVGPDPDVATIAFLHHTLSDEGQQVIADDDRGFFALTPETLTEARSLLETFDGAIPSYCPGTVTLSGGESFVTEDRAVTVLGYNDMAEMLTALGAAFSRRHPAIRFDFQLKGTRTAPPALASGRSAFAPMGAEFSPEQLTDYRAITGTDPLVFRIARASLNPRALSGPIAIIVHADNPLASLNLDEVAEIFSGRDTRGLNPCGLAPQTALGIFMRERVLEGGRFWENFRGFPQSRDVVEAVATDPRAIGFTAAMRVTPGVKVLALAAHASATPVALSEANLRAGLYPLDRFLLIYARRPLEPLVREFVDFVLSREGQRVIASGTLGYLPLNPHKVAVERAKLE